jgi:hypothetical protein
VARVPAEDAGDVPSAGAEAFNLFNRANFGSPNPVVFSWINISSSAGVITTAAAISRQLQFVLRLIF